MGSSSAKSNSRSTPGSQIKHGAHAPFLRHAIHCQGPPYQPCMTYDPPERRWQSPVKGSRITSVTSSITPLEPHWPYSTKYRWQSPIKGSRVTSVTSFVTPLGPHWPHSTIHGTSHGPIPHHVFLFETRVGEELILHGPCHKCSDSSSHALSPLHTPCDHAHHHAATIRSVSRGGVHYLKGEGGRKERSNAHTRARHML